jgi:hypothetical protein
LGSPPLTGIDWRRACRLVPSRYPTIGLFDRIAAPEDLPELYELEGWTNDRLSNELGLLHTVPPEEWVTGPMASVVMAAYCHPHAAGARFNGNNRGAWCAGRDLDTALTESTHRRTKELEEFGARDARVQMRLYHADFHAGFHDVRGAGWEHVHDPDDHSASQDLGRALFEAGSNGVVYRSVRHPGGECVVSFRPKLVANVRPTGHFEYRWHGGGQPEVIALEK